MDKNLDIDMDLPGVHFPEEDLPEAAPNELDEEDNDPENNSELEEQHNSNLDPDEEAFVHHLSPISERTKQRRTREDYSHRLEAEKIAWDAQLPLLSTAFMECEATGAKFLKEGWSFNCRVISITCESYILLAIYILADF